jgi:dihydrolipoamide dehydrogenase
VSLDVVVLGCGPAGYYAALACARAGLATAIVERAELGGTGFRWGCLPVKMMLDAVRARLQASPRRASLPAPPRPVPRAFGGRLLRRTAEAMAGVESGMEQRLRAAGVTIVFGEAELLDARTVRAGGRVVAAPTIVIATGTRPAAPQGIELDGETVVSHVDLVSWRALPRSAAIVGADVEGIEIACLLAHLGTRVELIEMQGEILPGQDRDIVQPVGERLSALGATFHLGAAAAAVRRHRGWADVLLSDGGSVRAEKVIVTGLRRPNLPRGLDAAGVAHEAHRIPVDARFRTSALNLYAIGDINGLCGMAHTAIQQGILLARVIRGGGPGPSAWPSLPRALYTIPEVAGAGAQARDLERLGVSYRRSTYQLADSWRGISKGIRDGFLTMLAGEDGRILGIWACGDGVSEIAAPFGALVDRGATADELLESLFIHPTLSEALLEAAWPLSTAASADRPPLSRGGR